MSSSVKIFSQLFAENEIISSSNPFYVYHIGTPKEYNTSIDIKNIPYIPILVREKKTHNFYSFNVEWHALYLYNLGQIINDDGTADSLQCISEYDTFLQEPITLIDPSKPQEISLNEMKYETGFYNDITDVKTYDQTYYRYKSTSGKNVYIPVMESLRFFYLHTPRRSLLKSMLYPNPIKRLYDKIETYTPKSKAKRGYSLHLNSTCNPDDASRLLYFILDQRHTKAFLDTAASILSEKVCAIPPVFGRKLKIKKGHMIQRGNNILILQIIASDMLNKLLDNTELKTYRKAKGKQGGPIDNTSSEPAQQPEAEPDNELDNNQPGSNPRPPKIPTFFDEHQLKSHKHDKIKTLEEEREKKRNNVYLYIKSIRNWSTLPFFKSTGNAIFLNPQYVLLLALDDTPEKGSTNNLSLTAFYKLQEALESRGYETTKTYIYLFRKNNFHMLTKENLKFSRKKAEAFTDKDQTNRRRYAFFKATKGKFSFYCVDVEKRESNNSKDYSPLLILLYSDPEEIFLPVIDELMFTRVWMGKKPWLEYFNHSFADNNPINKLEKEKMLSFAHSRIPDTIIDTIETYYIWGDNK